MNWVWLAGLLLALVPITSYGDSLPASPASPKTKDAIYLEAGPANNQANTGFQFGGGYGFGLDRNFYLVLSTQYFNSSAIYESSAFNSGINVTAGLSIWTVLANLRVNFTDRENPVVFYGIAGCGPGLIIRSASSYFSPSEDTQPFSRLGIGIDIHLFQRVSLSFEESVVYPFNGLPFYPNYTYNNLGLGSAVYPPFSWGLTLEQF